MSTVQAATSTSILNKETSKDGPSIPIHSGSAYVAANNYSYFRGMEEDVKKSIILLPGPYT
ncbi:hypothetical protein [[Anoxybacillus] calidus]|uniref:hypothetical protein n=1 Tax=[Anoxybacillus] calidus TaxID=575178 RepID=UPI0015EC4064|nr:hypothetical protein [Anoxybacillus calidus]